MLHELTATEVTRGILDTIPLISNTVKEGNMQNMEERIRSFYVEIVVGQIRTQTPSFWEFKACGAPKFFGIKDPIDSRH